MTHPTPTAPQHSKHHHHAPALVIATAPVPNAIPFASGASLLDSFSLFDDPGQRGSQAASTPTPTPSATATATLHPLLPTSSSTAAASASTSVLASASVSAAAGLGAVPPSSITTAPSSNNQHLSRSNTPLQSSNLSQSRTGSGLGLGSSVFDAFSSQKAPTPSLITGPTDFKDDPFKDYRYEDPFSIKDPFADDEEGISKAPARGQVRRRALPRTLAQRVSIILII